MPAADVYRQWLISLNPDLLKGPFNHEARQEVCLPRDWYDTSCWPVGALQQLGIHRKPPQQQVSSQQCTTHECETSNSTMLAPLHLQPGYQSVAAGVDTLQHSDDEGTLRTADILPALSNIKLEHLAGVGATAQLLDGKLNADSSQTPPTASFNCRQEPHKCGVSGDTVETAMLEHASVTQRHFVAAHASAAFTDSDLARTCCQEDVLLQQLRARLSQMLAVETAVV